MKTLLKLLASHEVLLLIVLILGLIVAGLIDPTFVSLNVQIFQSRDLWEWGLIALAMTPIILTAGIDLSVGAIMALSAVVLGLTFEATGNVWLAASLALLVGLMAGLLNGTFIAFVKVHPLIVTLATLSAFRGLAEGISLARPFGGFPTSFTQLGQPVALGFTLAGWLFVLLALAIGLILWKTPPGKWIRAIGYNETAARFTGIPVARTKLLLYGFSGLMSATAAVLYVARRPTAKADIGTGIELDVITAVVLGGTSIFGGRGSISGTVIGLILLHETRKFVSWRYNSDETIQIVVGTLLIAAVLLNTLLSRRRA